MTEFTLTTDEREWARRELSSPAPFLTAGSAPPHETSDMRLPWTVTHSPIEYALATAMQGVVVGVSSQCAPVGVVLGQAVDLGSLRPCRDVVAVVQDTLGAYKVDFALYARDLLGDLVMLVVECDGHEFHKTPEQAALDRLRDRELKWWFGAETIRFAGSEIHADPVTCALDVAMAMTDLLQRRVACARRALSVTGALV